MLHHEEHPEKPEDIMTAPISGQPPHLALPPPPHLSSFSDPPPPPHFHQF